jgi:hypothetical protein
MPKGWLCDGRRDNIWKVRMQRHALLGFYIACEPGCCCLLSRSEVYDLLILSLLKEITMTMWFHHTMIP